ncbi:hypothetical protein NIES4101_52820 [Calothrix sp. NIES-4101]|nr:hypothetical protein NIES4101_52820 [Calothrix sp. NIES-4101]
MLNLKQTYPKYLLSLIVLSLGISSVGIGGDRTTLAISNPSKNLNNINYLQPENTLIVQQYTGWIANIFQRRPRRRNGARNDVCSISPGWVDTYMVWNDKPLFLWRTMANGEPIKTPETKLIVREYESQKVIWTQPINLAQQKALYNGIETLQPGKLYQWLIVQQSRELTNPGLFKIMPTEEREKIQVELQAIEQQAKSTRISPEEIVLKKADYFLNYQVQHNTEKKSANLWSDALTLLYTVENPSYVQEREKLVQDICTPSTSTSS